MKLSKLSIKLALVSLIFSSPILAQQDAVGNWLMYFGTNKINDTWSIHSEVQYRNHTIAPVNAEQLLLRTGMNYRINKSAVVTLGYGYISGYEYESEQSSPESEEHRIWQQFILTNKVGRVKFEHRYRVEQRWVNNDYKNRFRYRLMLFVPLNKPVIEKGTVFLGLYDEVFVNGESPFFDRNRLYGAVGYQWNKISNVQVGMLNQQQEFVGKWYLQFAIFINPDFSKKSD